MRYIVFIFITLLFISCGSSKESIGDVNPPAICNNDSEKKFVYDVMHDSYLWADETPLLSEDKLSKYEDDKKLLEALKQPNDRFSFIMPKKDHDDYFEAGLNDGFGYFPSLIKDKNDTLMINVDFIYPDSPADKVGLKRGDRIIKFDDYNISQIVSNKELLNRYFGDEDKNLTVHMKLSDSREFDISKEEFEIKTVLHRSIIEQDGVKIGYLVYQSFIGTSTKELDESFAYFKANAVDELILDLRYNGGGYVYIANHLGALIGGDRVSGTIFNQSRYNKKYSKYNSTDYFEKTPKEALDLSRVFIITTDDSCSASELVINSLKASTNSVEVIQVGEPTCGKPYAMISLEYCDKYILPVQMESLNGDNEGGYINGIIPECSAIDDISRDFGDRNESMLYNALYYIENSRCRIKYSRSKSSLRRDKLIDGFKGIYGLY